MRVRNIIGLSALFIFMASFARKEPLVITSIAFDNNSLIPVKYTCEGDNISPPLKVNDIPGGTKTLALILHDPDATGSGGFTHWVMWNVSPNGDIPENFKNAQQGLNDSKQPGYTGMCPPSGTHHYHFRVYALDTTLNLDKSTDKAALESAIKGHVLAEGDLVGLYIK